MVTRGMVICGGTPASYELSQGLFAVMAAARGEVGPRLFRCGLLGGFFLGIFWKRARQRDALAGIGTSIALMSLIVFSKSILHAWPAGGVLLEPISQIAWPWYVLIGTSITFVTGMISSFIFVTRSDESCARFEISGNQTQPI